MEANETFYKDQIEKLSGELEKAKSRFRFYTLMRLLFFVLGVLFAWWFWLETLFVPMLALSLTGFIWAVARSVNAKYLRDIIGLKIEINRLEIKVLHGEWSSYEPGDEFKNPKHAYSHDLDLFGNKSIFQLINRTVSDQGKSKLARILANGADDIELNKAGISELKEHMGWSQDFLAEGLVDREDSKHDRPIHEICSIDTTNSAKIRILGIAIPLLSIISTVLVSFGFISVYAFSLIIILVLVLIGNEIRRTNKVAFGIVNFERRINIVKKQLLLYKNLQVQSPLMLEFKKKLFDEQNAVIHEIEALSSIINRFNFRMNFLVGLLLNFFLAWDFNMRLQLEKWMKTHREKLRLWEDHIASLEVWVSGATYQFNFPEAIFAKFSEDERIEVKDLRHPFIAKDKMVANSISFKQNQHFLIITGPNMAGKSTFLRSFGLIFVLANAGFPILATSVEIPRMKLFTSMRTTDDLHVESSYFHAELIRLRFIMDEIEKGEPVFVILDEILKGTNSKDKEIGSARFLRKLKRMGAYGLIATHDLSLCRLADEDEAFGNIYFDSVISGEEIYFDYLCRDGVCKNMNASFLLRQMKLIDEDGDIGFQV